MTKRILIVEDEQHASSRLKQLLHEISADNQVVAEADSLEEALRILRQEEYDLLFLDIHLGDSLSFEIFENLKILTPVIFTTAFDQYAIEAFKVNSIAYLLKPIQKDELAEAMQKLQELEQHAQSKNLHDVLVNLPKLNYQERFLVTQGQRIKSIPVSDIACFISEGRYSRLVDFHGASFLTNFTMEYLERNLNPRHFFRINRKQIIAFQAITSMVAWSKSRVKLEVAAKPDEEFIVSIDRSSEFKKWLDR